MDRVDSTRRKRTKTTRELERTGGRIIFKEEGAAKGIVAAAGSVRVIFLMPISGVGLIKTHTVRSNCLPLKARRRPKAI